MKRTKTRRDIKSKLIAAICMLMVSVIMMASTSYAWFTLSTAPEVKGIQTAVGANGNLEMALLGTQGSYDTPANISSAVGDSSAAEGKSPITANHTWGNLIDLSHESYGLSLIDLKPAALNTTGYVPTVGNTIAQLMLKMPTYGADGRVVDLTEANTMLAPYDSAKKSFTKVDTNGMTADQIAAIKHYGVRAIGTSTNRSQREIAYDRFMSQGAMAASIAKSNAAISLSSYGKVLGDIGVKGGLDPNATYDKNDLEKLQAMLDSIVGYETTITDNKGTPTTEDDTTTTITTPGIVDNILEALENYAIAAVASGWNEEPYENDEKFVEALVALQANPAGAYDIIGTLKNSFDDAVDQLGDIAESATSAQAALTTLKNANKSTYTRTEIMTVVGHLFDTETMTVCGLDIATIKGEGGTEKLLEAYGEYNNQIVVDMNGGIYSEIADLTDRFSGNTKLEVPNLGTPNATMQANKTDGVTQSVLGTIGNAIAGKPAPKGESANPSISDAYAYIIDMAFRTNASDSKLLLQTAAKQRIDGNAEETTMGGGSSMTFTSVEGFSGKQMKSLMSKINVVFFKNDGTNEILAVAKLDTTDLSDTATTMTAPLKIVSGEGFAEQTEAAICNMPTNTAVKISALVYLDGTAITNGDVGTGALSMSGRMNLQFSSSANLVPMDYSAGYAPANPVPENNGAAVNP